jgi:dolichol-phosphate mannosyltransferase
MIWIVLPAFNEEASLPKLLPKIDAKLREHQLDYRLVVVDDGSTDRTAEILAEFTGRLPMAVVTHAINRGLGETERDGFEFVADRCAPDDVIVRVEGDDTHDPQYILTLMQKLAEGFDVVNTSRFQPGGGQMGVSPYRAIISRGANLFMRLLFPVPNVRDFSCGFRAYRAQVVQDAVSVFGNNFIQLRGLGFTSTLEMVVKLHLLGCRCAEVPFVLRYDQKESTSKMASSITALGYLMMAILYHWPFGGWASQYRELRRLYLSNRDEAVARFARYPCRRRMVSQIGL